VLRGQADRRAAPAQDFGVAGAGVVVRPDGHLAVVLALRCAAPVSRRWCSPPHRSRPAT